MDKSNIKEKLFNFLMNKSLLTKEDKASDMAKSFGFEFTPEAIESGNPTIPDPTWTDVGSAGILNMLKHPFKGAALAGSFGGNVGGLMDNDKFGGQLGGLALGGLAASQLATGNPYMAAMMTMGGGNLGALFDKLRARKEQEQAQPYYGGR